MALTVSGKGVHHITSNLHLPADYFPEGEAGFSLFQGKCNLFFGIAGLFHGEYA
ncbi:hypothetical protein NXJ56_003751 [Salmonella enterica]|nr:hypothetical protein [Salmonella enterica]EHL4602948.1 hypothetical protein [Salmonella enterica subsp. enterica serovar Glostrup]EGW1221476.1 hypothetical protein [Salmonella enterica]EHF6764997.1 hypothetical protein [Salmonella enterica]EHN6228684.1 hypothetical protein [Salmonella enterica]